MYKPFHAHNHSLIYTERSSFNKSDYVTTTKATTHIYSYSHSFITYTNTLITRKSSVHNTQNAKNNNEYELCTSFVSGNV